MGILDVVGTGLKIAGAFVPGVSPILAGLEGVADIIGGDTGAKIKQGLGMLQDGLSGMSQTALTPEQQFLLEQNKENTKVELAKIELQRDQLPYQDQAGGRDLIKVESLSNDPVVRQARPKMMVLLGKWSIFYSFAGVSVVAYCTIAGVDVKNVEVLVNLLLYQGATMWTVFATSFTGYTVARTVDKRTAEGLNVPAILEKVAAIGKKISQ